MSPIHRSPQVLSRACQLFFEPVQPDLQAANLFAEGVVPGLNRSALPGSSIHKNLRELLHRGFPPLRDLDRMHFELRAQLTQRLLTTDRFNNHAGFERRAVLFSRRHQLLLRLTTRRNISLLPGLNFWDHYTIVEFCP